jgi:UDP-glucose 4-epimerase
MKILVTGGAGYIGSVLVNKLIEQGHKVNVIDDLSNGFRENIDKRAIFTEGSILDKDNLNKALEGVEMVYHLAAKIRVEEGESKPELYKKLICSRRVQLKKSTNSFLHLLQLSMETQMSFQLTKIQRLTQ